MAETEIKSINGRTLFDATSRQRIGELFDEFSEVSQELLETVSDLSKNKADKTDLTNPFNFKGSTTHSALPTTGNTINDTYYCTDLKRRYTWNGEAWYPSSLDETEYVDELNQLSEEIEEVDNRLSGDGEYICNSNNADALNSQILKTVWNTVAGEFEGADGCTLNVAKDPNGITWIEIDRTEIEIAKSPLLLFSIIPEEYRDIPVTKGDILKVDYDTSITYQIQYNVLNQEKEVIGSLSAITLGVSNKTKSLEITDDSVKYIRFRSIRLSISSTSAFKVKIGNIRVITEDMQKNGANLKEKLSIMHEKIENMKKKTPCVIICFDGCGSDILSDSRYALVKDTYGFNFTYAPSTDTTKTQLRNAVSKGLDIATYRKLDWPVDTYGLSSVNNTSDAEIVKAWDDYVHAGLIATENSGYFNPVAWFCRQNVYGINLENACKKYGYKLVRGYRYDNTNLHYVKDRETERMIYANPVLDDTYENVIEEMLSSISNGHDFCIFSHGLTDGSGGIYNDVSTSSWVAVLNVIKTLVDEGKAKVVTFREYYSLCDQMDSYENDYNRTMKMISD